VGAGAHSWHEGQRWHNHLYPADYIGALKTGEWPVAEEEVIPPALIQGETMMLGLRLAEGVADGDFRRRFGVSLAEVYAPTLTQLTETGLLEWDESRARLSMRGRLLGNPVFAAFLPDCLPG
jgi:oxygen-independent coproporphyrinogen-3 oxidase